MKNLGLKKEELKKFISKNWKPTKLTWAFMGIFFAALVVASAIMAVVSYPFSGPPIFSNDYLAILMAMIMIALTSIYYRYSKKTYGEGFNLAIGVTFLSVIAELAILVFAEIILGFESITLAYFIFTLPLSILSGIFVIFGTYLVIKDKKYKEAALMFVFMAISVFIIENLKLYSPLDGFTQVYYDLIPVALGKALTLGIPTAAYLDWFRKKKSLNAFYGAAIIGALLSVLALIKTGGVALVSLGNAMQLQSVLFVEKITHYYGLDYLAIFILAGVLVLVIEKIRATLDEK